MKCGIDQDGYTKVEDLDKLGQTNVICGISVQLYILLMIFKII